MADDEEDKQLMLFGRDVASIPCFRNSFLYGITGGLGTGLIFFMCTSRTQAASHFGFSSFFAITMAYWVYCRYQWSTNRFNILQLQAAMKQQAMYEGTEVEKKVFENVKT